MHLKSLLFSLFVLLTTALLTAPSLPAQWQHPESNTVTITFGTDTDAARQGRDGAKNGTATCSGLKDGATSGNFTCEGMSSDAGYHWVLETVGVRHDVVIKNAGGVTVGTLEGAGDKASTSGPATDAAGNGEWGGGWAR